MALFGTLMLGPTVPAQAGACVGLGECRLSGPWVKLLSLEYLLPKGGEVIPLSSFPGRKTP